MILKKYEDFINRVEELGFMALSNILPGFPSLSEETLKENWHTGDPDTDHGAGRIKPQRKNSWHSAAFLADIRVLYQHECIPCFIQLSIRRNTWSREEHPGR